MMLSALVEQINKQIFINFEDYLADFKGVKTLAF